MSASLEGTKKMRQNYSLPHVIRAGTYNVSAFFGTYKCNFFSGTYKVSGKNPKKNPRGTYKCNFLRHV